MIKEAHSADQAGYAAFSAQWSRMDGPLVDKIADPKLVLATQPLGQTLAIDRTGLVKLIKSTREVLLCIDATDRAMDSTGSKSYAASWIDLLGGDRDSEAEISADRANRVTLTSDDRKLDRLLDCSVDAVKNLQFASGGITVDFCKYKNSWLRDGTYSMIGLSLAGDDKAVERYFSFWSNQRSFSVGGELEAQQPAIAITGMWFFSRLSPDGPAFLQRLWPYVKYFADYYEKRIEKEGMLNLGEEWITNIPAPSSWPNAEVYSGLRAAAKIAGELGDAREAMEWNRSADRLKERFSVQAYDKDKARIIPIAGPPGQWYTNPDRPNDPHNGPMRDDRVDGGMLNTARLEAFGRGQGIVSVDDPKFASTQAQVIRDLELPDHSLQGFGPNPANPHSPRGLLTPNGLRCIMPFVTEFALQDEWLLGRTDLAWRYLLSGIMNKRGYDLMAMNNFIPEGWDERGVPGDPAYAWAHGDFITSTMLLFLGFDLEPPTGDLGLAPSLPPGMNHALIGNFRFRNWRLNVDLNRQPGGVDVTVSAISPPAGAKPLAIRIPTGELIELAAGRAAHFTVDPGKYYMSFGRSENAAERVSIFSKILTGKELASDPARMTRATQEEIICNLEATYVPR